MTDERLDFLLEGRERLSRPIGEVVDELHDLSSAATAGSRVLSRLESQADDAGDELRSVASQAGLAMTAVAGLDTTLSRLDDVQVDVDVDSPPALDLDTTRRVALDVDRAELRSALNSMDDEQIAINPVLSDFEATLADAATATEDDLNVDRERTVTTRTDNQLAAAAAQAALGDLGVSLERLPDDVQIDVQTDGVTETLAGLRTVRDQIADLDDEDARVSVTFDVDRSALDWLSDLDLGLADDAISADVDTGDERTVDIATSMDIRGAKAHLRAVESALSRVDGRTATAESDISLGQSEKQILDDIGAIHTALRGLPDDQTVAINTHADLDALVQAIDGYDDLPRSVRSELDVDAKTADSQAALAAVLSTAERLDDLDPTVDIDTDRDTSALSVLREGGDDFDFDLPELPDDGRDRHGSAIGDVFSGGSGVLRGAARGAPGLSGAVSAASGLGAAGLVGAGGALGGALAGATALGSAAGGLGVGGAAGLGSIAAPIALTVDDREISRTKAQISSQLDSVRANPVFEQMSNALLADSVRLTGDLAARLNSMDGVISGLFGDLRGSFLEEWPGILDSVEGSVRMLDDDLASIGEGTFSTIPKVIDSMAESADTVLPILGGWMSRLGPIAAGVESIGVGLFELVDAPIDNLLGYLGAMAPVAHLLGDGLKIAGDAMWVLDGAYNETMLRSFGNWVEWSAENVRWLAGGIYDLGGAIGLWDALATGAQLVGDGISWATDAAGTFIPTIVRASQAGIDAIYSLHNAINDLPLAEELPSVSAQDLTAPDLSSIGPDRGDDTGSGMPGSGSDPPAAPSVEAAAVQQSALDSLPSATASTQTPSSSPALSQGSTPASSPSTASPAAPASPTASATPVSSGGGSTGGDTYVTNKYDIDIDNSGGGNITRGKVERWMRRFHMREHERAIKQSGGMA